MIKLEVYEKFCGEQGKKAQEDSEDKRWDNACRYNQVRYTLSLASEDEGGLTHNGHGIR